MNLFILANTAADAARKHGDKHVVKMILEACQMLYTAHWVCAHPELLSCKSAIALSRAQKLLPAPFADAPTRKGTEERGFRPVHIHHPCTRWIRESRENYIFACELALALGAEYEHRWPGRGEHSCTAHARWLFANIPCELPSLGQTPFVMAMDDKYKISSDAILCYRYYYKMNKLRERGILKYTRRAIPGFLFAKERDSLRAEPVFQETSPQMPLLSV